MGLFSRKKKDEYDELPPLDDTELPLLPEDDTELPPLPDEGNELPPLPEEPVAPRLRTPGTSLPRMPAFLPSATSRPMKAKVFVRIDKYRDIMETIDSTQDKLRELERTINTISAIKSKESEIISGWHALLNDAKAKIDDMHAKLQRPSE